MNAYVARQPILDRKQRVYGYELLFRTSMENFFPKTDQDHATSQLLADSFLTVGMERLAGNTRAFINFPQNLLLKKTPLVLPPRMVVVEILEHVDPTEELIGACREMAKKGVKFALDDFVIGPQWLPLIEIADIIKFDVLMTPPDKLVEMVEAVSSYPVKLLAEKVETHADFEKFLAMGFEFFQGYFFSKPKIMHSKGIAPLKMNLLAIMTKISDPNLSLSELEALIARDTAVSYKLLRYINSAYFSTLQKISSIRHAVSLLGLDAVKRFASLLVMNQVAQDKPGELVRASAIRAQFCALLGQRSAKKNIRVDLFTLGLFSHIDALLDEAMESCLSQLPLDDAIKEALITRQGMVAGFLNLAVSYEKGDWAAALQLARKLAILEDYVPACYMEALKWSRALDAP